MSKEHNSSTDGEQTAENKSEHESRRENERESERERERALRGGVDVARPGVSVSYANAPNSDMWSDELRREVEDAKIAGWEIEDDFGDRVVMIQRDIGSGPMHAIIAILTFWWTLGIGNALYAAYRYWGAADKKVLRDHDAGQ